MHMERLLSGDTLHPCTCTSPWCANMRWPWIYLHKYTNWLFCQDRTSIRISSLPIVHFHLSRWHRLHMKMGTHTHIVSFSPASMAYYHRSHIETTHFSTTCAMVLPTAQNPVSSMQSMLRCRVATATAKTKKNGNTCIPPYVRVVCAWSMNLFKHCTHFTWKTTKTSQTIIFALFWCFWLI